MQVVHRERTDSRLSVACDTNNRLTEACSRYTDVPGRSRKDTGLSIILYFVGLFFVDMGTKRDSGDLPLRIWPGSC